MNIPLLDQFFIACLIAFIYAWYLLRKHFIENIRQLIQYILTGNDLSSVEVGITSQAYQQFVDIIQVVSSDDSLSSPALLRPFCRSIKIKFLLVRVKSHVELGFSYQNIDNSHSDKPHTRTISLSLSITRPSITGKWVVSNVEICT